MTRRHGETSEYQVGEELFIEIRNPKSRLRVSQSTGFTFETSLEPDRLFRYGRMFRRPNLPEFRPESKGLIALGKVMRGSTPSDHANNIPAGYVYFGQFVDHDLSF